MLARLGGEMGCSLQLRAYGTHYPATTGYASSNLSAWLQNREVETVSSSIRMRGQDAGPIQVP